jgi:hypothetical protein
MPYIKQENRLQFDKAAEEVANKAECAGDLNYAITVILHNYIKKKGLKYDTLNSVHGMLDCCNKELYRKITAPYEDSKAIENGDVNLIPEELNKASQVKPLIWTSCSKCKGIGFAEFSNPNGSKCKVICNDCLGYGELCNLDNLVITSKTVVDGKHFMSFIDKDGDTIWEEDFTEEGVLEKITLLYKESLYEERYFGKAPGLNT